MTNYHQLLAIVDSFPEGLAVTDEEGNFILVNRIYENYMGLARNEILGKNVTELIENKQISDSVVLLVLRSRRQESILQLVPKTKKELLLTANPVFDDQGEIIQIVFVLRDITEMKKLQQRLNESLKESELYKEELRRMQKGVSNEEIIYKSKKMERIVGLADKIAFFDSTVLILGESGVGKELLAQKIYKMSCRSEAPFVAVNCGAIPNSLIESELFGYEEGAFTGAKKKGKLGLFELAQSGTLFLDEVGELPLNVQTALLRVLQSKKIIRVGGTTSISVDFRLIAATNKDLYEMVQQKSFRSDLYYRLNVVPIKIPSLRERKEDIPILVSHFLTKYNKKYKEQKCFSGEIMDRFITHNWPGNIRELENMVERLVVTSSDAVISQWIQSQDTEGDKQYHLFSSLKQCQQEVEKEMILQAYKSLKSTYKVAKALGVNQSTIVRKMQRNEIPRIPNEKTH